MAEAMKISVAMATYNGAEWISEQLDSFLSQTRPPDELVITDDQSRDATVEIARAFGQRAPFTVRVEVNENTLGVRGNFERALSLCTGDIILLCDQDDTWFDTKIERHIALLETVDRPACVMTDAVLTDGALNATGRTKLGALRAAGLPDRDFVMGCCVGMRRDLLDLALPIPSTAAAHDSWVVGLSDALGLTLRVEEAHQLYRRHGKNESQFFVNAVEAPRLGQRLGDSVARLRRRIGSTAGADQELRDLAIVRERIADRREAVVSLVGEDRTARIEGDLSVRLDVLLRRREVRRLPLLNRIRAAAALWRESGYRRSGGVAGLLKDVVSLDLTRQTP